MLDTNICIYIIKKRPIQVFTKLREFSPSDIGISTITLSELEFGVAKSSNPEKNKIALTEFLAPIEILPFDDCAAQEYGAIRKYLQERGTPIGPLDTLIAAHTKSIGCTLVTNNVSEFCRVPELIVDNWI